MKKLIFVIAGLCCATAWAAEQKAKPESALLPASAYRMPLDDIVVQGRAPYWQRDTPRFDKPKLTAPKPGDADAGRLQWAPPYARDEREDYNGVRDQLNPKARAKIFEIHF